MDPIIEFSDVTYSYGKRQVLRGVDWAVQPGATALLGPNGAGKTTLLSIAVGLLRPRSGSVVVTGHDIAAGPSRAVVERMVGFVPQRSEFPGRMKVVDVVGYGAWLNGVADRDVPAAAAAALAETGLSELAGRRVKTLSGGQRQRVTLALGIAHAPVVLVLDEPTVGLDPGQRLRMREMVSSLASARALVISTHLLEDVLHLCKRVGVLAEGRIAYDGSVDELVSRVTTTEAGGDLGSRFERAYEQLVRGLAGSEL